MNLQEENSQNTPCAGSGCFSRRGFLLAGGLAASTVLLKDVFPHRVAAADAQQQAQFSGYPRQKIGRVSELSVEEPQAFNYPDNDAGCSCLLFKLGRPAGGGVGPEEDIVAFSALCTHMGGRLAGTFKPDHAVLGPCPEHLTTFDLTRHGIVVAGHATQELPQIVLETEGDDVYAVGVLRLLYGRSCNIAT